MQLHLQKYECGSFHNRYLLRWLLPNGKIANPGQSWETFICASNKCQLAIIWLTSKTLILFSLTAKLTNVVSASNWFYAFCIFWPNTTFHDSLTRPRRAIECVAAYATESGLANTYIHGVLQFIDRATPHEVTSVQTVFLRLDSLKHSS